MRKNELIRVVSFTPSLDLRVAAVNLGQIVASPIRPLRFRDDIRRLRSLFNAYVRACPPPWFAPGLAITPEITRQSELWLPLSVIRPVFECLYRAALTYRPILSSSPLSTAASWAAVVAALPPFAGCSADPAALLERLLADDELRVEVLCWSFMPRRFYGSGSDRYPGQADFIRTWLSRRRKGKQLRCLDAACGDGAATYGLARLLLQLGWPPESFAVEGWSLDPLEVWAAAHACFPHDPFRQREFRTLLTPLFTGVARRSIVFRAMDLEDIRYSPASAGENAGFDLIVCNGLLGGPIINQPHRIEAIVRNLTELLRPDGLLLVADHFHGGWKKHIPGEALGEMVRSCGLKVRRAGEGIAGFNVV